MNPRDQIIKLEQRLSRSVVGQDDIAERLILALLADGSVLLEGAQIDALQVVQRLALNLDAEFRHVSFPPREPRHTPEDAPRLDDPNGLFSPDAMFANIILVENIDQAPDSIQESLFAAISQREIVVGNFTAHPLPALFLVLATQSAGDTDAPPAGSEMQRDHFLLHVRTKEPISLAASRQFSARDFAYGQADLHHRLHERRDEPPAWRMYDFIPQRAIFDARCQVRQVLIPDPVDACIGAITAALHNPGRYAPDLQSWIGSTFGLRGAIALERASQAYAWRDGRDTVIFDDVRAVAPDCLRHRLAMSNRAITEGRTADDLVNILLERLSTEPLSTDRGISRILSHPPAISSWTHS